MEVVVAEKVAEKAIDGLIDSIWRQIGYIWNYKSNMEDLQKQLKKLIAERDGIRHQVREARNKGEEIEEIVKIWLIDAEKAIEATNEILQLKEGGEGSCFMGCHPDLKTRYVFSRKAKKEMLPNVADVRRENKFTRIGYRVAVQELGFRKDYEMIQSRAQVLEKIEGALKIDVNVIGVYGLGGVGKSTLLKQLTSQVKANGLFKVVATATITQTPDRKRIQQELADWLDFTLDVDSPDVRATKLHARLRKEEKVLVILDDIWGKIKLEDIGIPYGDDHKGCKILMASRNRSVFSQMDVKEDFIFWLQVLNDEEALSLFQKIAGTPEDPELLVQIAERCGGLPVLIEPVATALRGKQLFEWKDALEDLKRSFNDKGLEAQGYQALHLSFKFLNDDQKSLFLLCSQLVPHSIDITDLLKYTIGLGLFNQRSTSLPTVESVQNRLLTVVSQLKESCLLLEGDDKFEVKMHDVVHAFATSIASDQLRVFNGAYVTDLDEWPGDDTFEQCTAISLPHCKIPQLPQELKCQQLCSFLLYNDDPSLEIPDNLFSTAKKLRLVDISEVNLSILPSSLQFLENLATLCLDRCDLQDISAIGKLKNLQVLSLMGSTISRLPRELSGLTRLQFLDLSTCDCLEVIPKGVLNCLTKLEYLYMGNSFVQWEGEGHICETNNVNLVELKLLSNLTSMEIHILDAKILPVNLFSKKLETFKIFIGDNWGDWSGKYETSRTLKLTLNMRNQLEKIKVPLMTTEDLYLDNLKGMENVLPELDGQGFPKLKHLHVRNGHDTQCIIDWKRMNDVIAFGKLESLSLHNLNSVKKIFHGKFTNGSFDNLKKLKVDNCNQLTYLFSFSMFKCLVQLQEISVSSCQIMKGIVSARYEDEDDVQDETIELTKLHTLRLENLPQFAGFCSQIAATNEGYGEILSVNGSRKLVGRKIRFPGLVDLKLSSINVERIWHDQIIEVSSFERLTTLIVDGCGKLGYMLTSSMVGSLAQLKHVEICECNSMEEVITAEGVVEEVIFPKLDFLKLIGLPKLVRFVTSNFINCPSLEVLWIENCPQLRAFTDVETRSRADHTLFNEKVLFPNLEEIYIIHMHKLKMIWNEELGSESFRRLKTVKVEHGKDLLKVFPSKQLRRFMNVESLILEKCDLLEEVFDLQMLIKSKERHTSQLKTLDVRDLLKLKHVWNGDSQGILSFHNLTEVTVWNCVNLRVLFQASVARNLHLLEQLNIDDCGIKEIISKDGDELESTLSFIFPQLKSLDLWRLEHLTSFYNGIHTLDCPQLKTVRINDCDHVDLFGFASQDQCQQSFLSLTMVPNFEVIIINGKDIPMLRQGRFPLDSLIELKDVQLQRFDKSMELPFDLLSKFHVLHSLSLSCSDLEELFPNDNANEVGSTLARIRHLSLTHLPYTTHIWKQGSPPLHFLQNLDTLEIWSCNSLVCLEGFSRSFHNLSVLEVGNCEALVNLGSCSAISSLVNLTSMTITLCRNMREIIAPSEDDKSKFQSDDIIFRKLQTLELHSLEKITSFCSTTCTIKFPSLEEISVVQCPNMKIFSQGVLNAPKLKRVYVKKEEDRWRWIGDLNTTIKHLYTEMVGFYGLEELTLSNHPQLQQIWHEHDQLPVNFFCNLRGLVIDECQNFSVSVSSNLLPLLYTLESLEVRNCNSMEQVFFLESSYDNEVLGYLSNLEQLHLIDLPRLRGVLNEVPKGCLDFKNLKLLKIHDCNSLTNIFLPNMLLDLEQLENLEVKRCLKVEEIITEGIGKRDTMSEIKLCQLRSLTLEDLPELSRFCTCDSFECASLKELCIQNCPRLITFLSCSATSNVIANNEVDISNIALFDDKVALPVLERMELLNMDNMKMIWHDDLHSNSFSTLKELKLKEDKQLVKVFPLSMWRSLLSIEDLTIEDCESIEVVFDIQELRKVYLYQTAESQLRKLNIKKLRNLKHIWNKDPSGFVLFDKLISTYVWYCQDLKNIFPASIASGLQHLEILDIQGCGVEELVARVEGVESTPRFVFPQLERLYLWRLEKLKYLYEGNHTLELPKLKTLDVGWCNHLQIIASEYDILRRKQMGVQPFLSFQVVSPYETHPKTLSVDMEILCNTCFFKSLTSLTIHGCNKLKYVFSSSTVESFINLEGLAIYNCKMMEDVLVMDRFEETTRSKMVLNKLNSLYLRDLPKLARFCMCDVIECTALKVLSLENCPRLITFVSNSASTESDISISSLFDEKVVLPILEKLEILNMDNVKMIWDNDLYLDSFTTLKELKLKRNKQLVKIFPSSMWRNLQNLEVLVVSDCVSVEVVFDIKELMEANVNKTVESRLSKLKIKNLQNLKHIWNKDPLGFVLFDKLTSMYVLYCPRLNCIFPASIASGLPHLENLNIDGCGVKELIANVEGMKATPLFVFPQPETLSLWRLKHLYKGNYTLECPKLKSLDVYRCNSLQIFGSEYKNLQDKHARTQPLFTFLEVSQSNQVLQMLETLSIDGCGNLHCLAPSSASFGSLMILEVASCRRLVSLLTSSTAKSLAQLTQMTVKDCKELKGIIANGGDEPKEEIVFTKLESLRIRELPSLVSFCLEDHSLMFPSLTIVLVETCPIMQFFSKGDISTPNLRRVDLIGDDDDDDDERQIDVEENRWRWNGNLNDTIRKLYEEQRRQTT